MFVINENKSNQVKADNALQKKVLNTVQGRLSGPWFLVILLSETWKM